MSGTHSSCWMDEGCLVGRPEECPPQIAKARRDAGRPWHRLEIRRGPGGLRHYVDGVAVHCGAVVTLQAIETRCDDYGSWTVYLERGTTVRYEADIQRDAICATAHAFVGGHEFVARVEKWMRFAWRVE